MRFPKVFRRKRRAPEVVPASVSMGTLFRWYCYDVGIEDPNKLSNLLGLTPISKDVEDMELKDSYQRLEYIEPIMAFLRAMAEINSAAISENQFALFENALPDMSDEDKGHLKEHMRMLANVISLTALVSTFSSAIHVGLVEPTGLVLGESNRLGEL
jgi:hypothetical protein